MKKPNLTKCPIYRGKINVLGGTNMALKLGKTKIADKCGNTIDRVVIDLSYESSISNKPKLKQMHLSGKIYLEGLYFGLTLRYISIKDIYNTYYLTIGAYFPAYAIY
jgi:hypothetical protein